MRLHFDGPGDCQADCENRAPEQSKKDPHAEAPSSVMGCNPDPNPHWQVEDNAVHVTATPDGGASAGRAGGDAHPGLLEQTRAARREWRDPEEAEQPERRRGQHALDCQAEARTKRTDRSDDRQPAHYWLRSRARVSGRREGRECAGRSGERERAREILGRTGRWWVSRAPTT